MVSTKPQLQKIVPLYSDLVDLLVEFLEPCIDYTVPKCTHKNAFCRCGYLFEFRSSVLAPERVLLEQFCPFCGTPNPHKTNSLNGFPFLVRAKKHLACPRCFKHASSYEHRFCSSCQHKLAFI